MYVTLNPAAAQNEADQGRDASSRDSTFFLTPLHILVHELQT